MGEINCTGRGGGKGKLTGGEKKTPWWSQKASTGYVNEEGLNTGRIDLRRRTSKGKQCATIRGGGEKNNLGWEGDNCKGKGRGIVPVIWRKPNDLVPLWGKKNPNWNLLGASGGGGGKVAWKRGAR